MFLKIYLFIFWGLVSFNFLYLYVAFLMHSLVYLVVIFLACTFVVLANVAKSLIHVFCSELFLGAEGGGGMCLPSVAIMGCVCQFIVFFTMYIVFLIRW